MDAVDAAWKYWEIDRKWTASIWGYGLCITQLEESGQFRYTLFEPTDEDNMQPLRFGYCATLESAKAQSEQWALTYVLYD